MNSCRVFNYSTNNIYANDYYNACHEFDKIREKVIKYEHQTDDRESPEYKKMMAEFNFWDHKVPETSNIAGKEEKRLQEEQRAKKEQQNYNTSPFYKDDKLDYFA